MVTGLLLEVEGCMEQFVKVYSILSLKCILLTIYKLANFAVNPINYT